MNDVSVKVAFGSLILDAGDASPDDQEIASRIQQLASIRKEKEHLKRVLDMIEDQERSLRDEIQNAMYNGHSRSVECAGLQIVIKRTTSIEADVEMLRQELDDRGLLAEHLRLDLTAAKKTGSRLKLASITTHRRDVLSVKEINDDRSSDGHSSEVDSVRDVQVTNDARS